MARHACSIDEVHKEWITKYAKQMKLEFPEALDRALKLSRSRINALRNYAEAHPYKPKGKARKATPKAKKPAKKVARKAKPKSEASPAPAAQAATA